jgi:3'-5' exoribonuclease 1
MDTDWVLPHVNLKQQHGSIRKLQRAIGMKNALQLESIPLEGTHHRGIDDARNIAKIFLRYFDKWSFETNKV